ncbi:MAG: HAD-IIIA family hydrolase [bacterium]|nr:HAD-IIIA family hydrolase [bacterium]
MVFETRKRPTGPDELAEHVQRLLARGGYHHSTAELRASFASGFAALKHWKHSSSRRPEPTEMSHREVVGDFLASDLPAGPRALLIAEASGLLETISTTISDHLIRPGIPELLAYCQEASIPVGIVSNAHSGRSHRRIMREAGLEPYFAVQVYSDEVGIRKPHPRMIGLAAEALGLTPDQTWYVGDTQDRDVQAGRRAGVAAVLVTRSHHTDNPPFAVVHAADATFDDPRGVLAALRASHSPTTQAHLPYQPYPASSEPPTTEARVPYQAHPASSVGEGSALLIDHGGVISQTVTVPADLEAFAAEVAGQLNRIPGDQTTAEEILAGIAGARADHKEWKRALLAAHQSDGTAIREVTAPQFWGSVAEHLGRHHTWFRAEAEDLMQRYGRAKSRRKVRPGMRELLAACAEAGMQIVVVSNTVSGRGAVRASIEEHGLAEYITAYVCSDEVGLRKPEPGIFTEALTIAGANPEHTWFLGDKPANDAAGALAAGIAHRVLITGGSTDAAELEAALTDGTATAVVDSPLELVSLIRHRIAS